VRFTEPDASKPGRSWSVEATVGENNGRKWLGGRLSCFSRDLDFDFDPAVPRVYRELVSKGIVHADGIRLSGNAIEITSEVDIEWLVALIRGRYRKRNIIVLSADLYGYCAINPEIFSNRLCGVAHVCRIYPNASFLLSETVGKYLSVFDSGIRIYKPTSDFESDDPLRHTLYTKRLLERMDLNEVQRSILLDAFATSVSSALTHNSIPTFAQIRAANATAALGQMQANSGAQEIETLRAQLVAANAARAAAEANAETSFDLAIQEEQKREEAESERNQERARAMVLAARVRSLEAQAPVVETPVVRPTEYDQVPVWIENQFAGRMRLLPSR
jgi:hypothetical protein